MNEYSHFRRCWLTLRATASAKLRKQMDAIECAAEGIRIQPPKKKQEDKAHAPDYVRV
jgi:hypothetical protein